MIASLKQSYKIKRIKAQEECENFITQLREVQEFDEMYVELLKKRFNVVKTEIAEESVQLKKEIEELKNKINKYLDSNKIDRTKLRPKYECALCDDTGVVNGKTCSCLLKELNEKMSLKNSTQSVFKSFDECDERLMDENDKKTQAFLMSWCEKYPAVTKLNITVSGGAGCGKTFMMECVANSMMKRGFEICYKTAFELNELARLYHIGKSYNFVDCLNAEILFIDDLGTEPVLKNVTKEYLYNLINSRQINKKPTFISTNLSLENIVDRYDDRIFSRLANKNISLFIQLNKNDKRM